MSNGTDPTDLEIKDTYSMDKREGFRLLYRKYSDRILSVCKRYSADKGESMDYFQEAMLKIYDKMRSYSHDGEGSLFRWISRVTVNMIVDKRRREEKWKMEVIDNQREDTYIDEGSDDLETIPVEEIYKMVGKLSAARRTVFNLFAVEGYSYKEIGEMLGISEDGASSTMSKARKDLARLVKEYLKAQGDEGLDRSYKG